MTEAPNPEREALLPEADAAPVDWHRLSTEASLSALRTTRAGLTREESGRRRATYGANALDETPVHSPWGLFFGQFADFRTLFGPAIGELTSFDTRGPVLGGATVNEGCLFLGRQLH